MRKRYINPEIIQDERLAELEPLTRLFFTHLCILADENGCLEDRPKRIKIQALPYDNVNCEELLDTLTGNGFLARFEKDGVQYISIVNFAKYQDSSQCDSAERVRRYRQRQKEAKVSLTKTVMLPVTDPALPVTVTVTDNVTPVTLRACDYNNARVKEENNNINNSFQENNKKELNNESNPHHKGILTHAYAREDVTPSAESLREELPHDLPPAQPVEQSSQSVTTTQLFPKPQLRVVDGGTVGGDGQFSKNGSWLNQKREPPYLCGSFSVHMKPEASDRQLDVEFDKLFKAYPKQINYDGAFLAYVDKHMQKKLPPLDELLAAIEQQKLSSQWQNPKYIPSLVHWIEKRRWLDKMPTAAEDRAKAEAVKAVTEEPKDTRPEWQKTHPHFNDDIGSGYIDELLAKYGKKVIGR